MKPFERTGMHDYRDARSLARPVGAYDYLRDRRFACRCPVAVRWAFRVRRLTEWARAHWRAAFIALAFLVVGRWDYDDELQRARDLAARLQTHQLDRADLSARMSREDVPQ